MKLSEYLAQRRGRAVSLAAAVGVHPVMVSQWASGVKRVSVMRCVAIEEATGGAVTRKDLRPDDWHAHWPELAISAQAPARIPVYVPPPESWRQRWARRLRNAGESVRRAFDGH
jgi:DNA-binding transcriptional regulator YdaS (Cro superfamily)